MSGLVLANTDNVMPCKELVFDPFGNYSVRYTRTFKNLKVRILQWSIITWSEMGQKTGQANKDLLEVNSIHYFHYIGNLDAFQ